MFVFKNLFIFSFYLTKLALLRSAEDIWRMSQIDIIACFQDFLLGKDQRDDCRMVFSTHTLLNENNIYYSLTEIATLYGDYFLGLNGSTYKSNAIGLFHDYYHHCGDSQNSYDKLSPDFNRWVNYIDTVKLMLRPERIALHQIMIAVSTDLQVGSEDDFYQIVMNLRTFLADKINQAAQALNSKRTLDQACLVRGDSLSAIQLINIDKLSYQRASETMRVIIEKGMIDFIDCFPVYKKINLNDPSETMIFALAGGPASGKTSFLIHLKETIEAQGKNWKNYIKINTDIYRHILLEPDSIPTIFYEQMVLFEASYVKLLTKNRLIEMQKNNRSRHIVFDQIDILAEDMDCLAGNDVRSELFILTTQVKNAIDRSLSRGEKTGRYVSMKKILQSYKNTVDSFFKNLSLLYGKKIRLDIFVPSDAG